MTSEPESESGSGPELLIFRHWTLSPVWEGNLLLSLRRALNIEAQLQVSLHVALLLVVN